MKMPFENDGGDSHLTRVLRENGRLAHAVGSLNQLIANQVNDVHAV